MQIDLFIKCADFAIIAQNSNPFQHGITPFLTSLNSYLKISIPYVSNEIVAKKSANTIKSYLFEQNRTATPNPTNANLYNTVAKSIIMFESYYLPWLSWAQKNLAGKINVEFTSKLINSITSMLEDLKMVQKGEVSQYKPFEIYISGTLPPTDIDQLSLDEQANQEQQEAIK